MSIKFATNEGEKVHCSALLDAMRYVRVMQPSGTRAKVTQGKTEDWRKLIRKSL